MPVTTVEIHELPARFAEMVGVATAGTEVIVTDGTVPRAKLVPLSPTPARVPGLHAGAIQTAEDFDAPLPEEFWLGTP
jgi:antitoxin (DNA-binding transcriptional repressor) of toxin-antitoxin stability system